MLDFWEAFEQIAVSIIRIIIAFVNAFDDVIDTSQSASENVL